NHQPCPNQARCWLLQGVLCLFAGLLLLLGGCSSSGGGGKVDAPTEPSPALQQHTVADLLTQYRTAVVQQDIDRLDALLQRDAAQASTRLQPTPGSSVLDASMFRDAIATLFRTVSITDLQLPPEAIQIAPDACCVTFLEVESLEDPKAL